LYSTVIVAHVAHGDAGHQFAATGFLLRALEHPLADDVQFCLGHRSLETQKQPVVVGRRIVQPVEVADQRAEDGAQFEQLVPVLARSRQPSGLPGDGVQTREARSESLAETQRQHVAAGGDCRSDLQRWNKTRRLSFRLHPRHLTIALV